MKLLICTQAIDLDDPVLGFFCRWVEEFSKHCQSVQVICLKEGRHSLPANVHIHSLGKEHVYRIPYTVYRIRSVQRILYALRFWRHIWRLRREYDSVFVHMNQEYVLLGGKFWRLWRKRVVLWRNHKIGSTWTRIAGFLAHAVCHTSPSAFVAKFKNAVRMPIGIDTNFFTLPAKPAPRGTILFLGRLDPVKKPELFLSALKKLHDVGVEFHADIYGDPTDSNSAHVAEFKSQSESLVASGALMLHKGVSNDKTPAIYAEHAIYVNLTLPGSFDKTIGEAMASGCVAVVANDAIREVIPPIYLVNPESLESVAAGIRAALMMPNEERAAFAKKSRDYIVREHSLTLLVTRLRKILTK